LSFSIDAKLTRERLKHVRRSVQDAVKISWSQRASVTEIRGS